MKDYAENLNMPLERVRDPIYRPIVTAFQQMNAEQQAAMHAFARLVLVDTISSLFGILDGSSRMRDFGEEFSVMYEGEKLNGNLQDDFLAKEQELEGKS
ncbi:helicase RepA family protein [Pendulispora rubella]|uniref:Helicase RepA family protein n=1 Tax=Pendulispora rubella TaxID=2741070 RepID=A0ABZ2L158_9BACT